MGQDMVSLGKCSVCIDSNDYSVTIGCSSANTNQIELVDSVVQVFYVLNDFLSVPSVIDKGVLKFLTIITDLSVFPCNSHFFLHVFWSSVIEYVHLGYFGLLINWFLSYYDMIFFILGNTLCFEIHFDNNMVIPDFLWLVFIQHIVFHSFIFNLFLLSYSQYVSCRQLRAGSCFRIQPDPISVVFRPLLFNVSIRILRLSLSSCSWFSYLFSLLFFNWSFLWFYFILYWLTSHKYIVLAVVVVEFAEYIFNLLQLTLKWYYTNSYVV